VLTGTFGTENVPSSVVVTVRTTKSDFEGSVTVTVAPGTPAPLESFTVPTMEPVISCPITNPLRNIAVAIQNKIDINFCLIITFFLFPPKN
jgi:hypothetical protein